MNDEELKPILVIETETGPLEIMPVTEPPTQKDYDRYYRALYRLLIDKEEVKNNRNLHLLW